MPQHSPTGYSAAQIGLHWLIALLVAFQLLFGEAMGEVASATEKGEAVAAGDRFLADAHYWIGLAILALMALRVVLRLTRGAPAAPSGTGRLRAGAAAVVHGLFYVILLGMPLSGLAAVHVAPAIGEFHEIGKPILLVLILLHVGGVVAHQLSSHDGVMKRMMAPGP